MSQIFFDTNLFIYLLEDNGSKSQEVARLLRLMEARGDVLATSTITLGEVLVKPLELNDTSLVDRYRSLLLSIGVNLIGFDAEAAEIYAQLRRDRSIRPPDAIQLACAAKARCDLFVTNDERLTKKTVPGIQFISALAAVPL